MSNVEFGAAPLVQYYSVFSSQPSLGNGTLIQYTMKQFPLYHGLAIHPEVTFVNVHHAQMFTFVIEVCLWYIGFVLVLISSFHYKD